MQYCPSNTVHTLNETKQRQRSTHNTVHKESSCLIMTEGIMYERLITFSTVIGYWVRGGVTHL